MGVAAWGICVFSLVALVYPPLLHRLTLESVRYDSLAWAADGQAITFRRSFEEDHDFYRIDVQGGEPERIAAPQSVASMSDLSPDGTMQVVQDDRNNLWVMNVDGSEKHLLVAQTDQETEPFTYQFAWSPNSRQLVFQANTFEYVEEIKLIRPRLFGNKAETLVTIDDLKANSLEVFKWSPDSRTLALVARYVCCDKEDQGEYHAIFTIFTGDTPQPQASTLSLIGKDSGGAAAQDISPPQLVFRTSHRFEFVDDVAWSSDGKQIAVSTSFADNSYYDAPRLYTVQVGDQRARRIYGQLNGIGAFIKDLQGGFEEEYPFTSPATIGIFLAPLLLIPLLRLYWQCARSLKIGLVVYYVLLIILYGALFVFALYVGAHTA